LRHLLNLLIIILTINIALIAIFTGTNLITRYPDLYSFEFTNTEIFNEIDLVYDEDELANIFSNYLFGEISDFQIVAEYQGREVEVFSNQEQIGMQNLKTLLNYIFIISIIILPISILIVLFMIRKGWKVLVRRAYNYSLGLFGIFWVAIWISYFAGWFSKLTNYYIITGINDSETVLGLLINTGFQRDWLLFTMIASSVFMLIVRMIIWKYTKERRMFV
jgi:hypothetical protein